MKQTKKLCNKVVIQKGITKEQEARKELMPCSKCHRETSMKFCTDCVQKEVQRERQRILKIINIDINKVMADGTSLKTLNNIMNSIPYEEVTRTRLADELRTEAIKWIKEMNGAGYSFPFPTTKWIKHFFNITEEENEEGSQCENEWYELIHKIEEKQ